MSAAIGRSCWFVDESVARAADGLDALGAEGLIDLLAQIADVHLDDVRVALEVDAPHVVEDVGLRRDAPVLAHEELEQCELACGQPDVGALTPRASRARIEFQSPD